MSSADFVLTADAEFDDLPRTLRREREAREREKRERADRERGDRSRAADPLRSRERDEEAPVIRRSDSGLHVPAADSLDLSDSISADYPAATVKRLDVPFLHLVTFFLKAVVASVPALILLGAILWAMGQMLKLLFPWLVKMQIFIQFPN